MRVDFRAVLFLLCTCFASLVVAEEAFRPTYWTLNLKPHDEIPLAKVAMVGGETFPGEYGVHFQLNELSSKQPVDIFLQSVGGEPLELIAFKTEPHEPLLQVSTGSKETATLSFRASGPVYFRISGEEGTSYQLIVVVGPELELEQGASQNFIPMSQATTSKQASEVDAAAEGETQPASTPAAAQEESGVSTMIVVLLALILLVLGVIAYALLRGRRGAAALLAFSVVPLLGQPIDAEAALPLGMDPKYQEKIKPHLIDRSSTKPEGKGFVLGAKDRYDNVQKFHGTASSVIGAASGLAGMAKKYGWMDPKDAAVQPNYSPRGMPSLPASILDDGKATGNMMIEYQEIADKIEKARRHLEGNYVVLKETELEAGMVKELANAAAGLSPFAQLAWTQMKANPKTSFNVSAAKFYGKYDAGQESGLNYLGEALKEMGAFEEKYYGYRNWYVYHGLPFHQFMTTRYIRPDR